MLTLNILIVSIIQGVTEFLPISSSAHLILFPALTGATDQGLTIDVAVHVGTLAAVMLYFRRDVVVATRGGLHLMRGGTATPEARLMLMLIVATIPVVLAGLVVSLAGLSQALRSVEVIAWTTFNFGLLLWVADRLGARFKTAEGWIWRDAVLMGLAQMLALAPGVSRSGVAITAARALGYERVDAARLSMLMSIPTIIAAGALIGLDLVKSSDWALSADALVAAGLALISALIALTLMMRMLATWSLTPFVIYRLALGAVLFWIVYG
jgi:undecaprenyl-diphosphatase